MFCISCIPKLHRWGTLYFKLYTRCTTYHVLYALLAFPGCTNEALYTLASNRNALLPLSARGGQFIAFLTAWSASNFGAKLLFSSRGEGCFYIHTIGIALVSNVYSCSGISRISKYCSIEVNFKVLKRLNWGHCDTVSLCAAHNWIAKNGNFLQIDSRKAFTCPFYTALHVAITVSL